MSKQWKIALHGGAGTIPRSAGADEIALARAGVSAALEAGAEVLRAGGTALDATQAAVQSLEDCIEFNAGRGAVYNSLGFHELDAAIMDGRTRRCGAVAAVRDVRNPIAAARAVMERSIHVLLVGEGAEQFAERSGVERVDPAYFHSELRRRQFEELRGSDRSELDHSRGSRGTVGAVAMDAEGHLAAATSTGGMTNKLHGRVGDAPIIGAGTYADDTSLAVSCTGTGEEFIRAGAAHFLHMSLVYRSMDLESAVEELLEKVLPDDTGGLVAISGDGTVALGFNSLGMYRGSLAAGEDPFIAIWENE